MKHSFWLIGTLRCIVRSGASAPSPALGPGEYTLYATLQSAEFPLRTAPARLQVVIPR